MATAFDKILAQGIRKGQVPARTASARKWYRQMAQTQGTRNVGKNDKSRLVSSVVPGSMYMFNYDPKHKETLPYYDRFPLIFPIGPANKGFYGINFHYLPHQMRAQLMDILYRIASDDRFDANTKLNLNFKVLKTIARTPYYKAITKHYLNKHVRSQFIYVYPSEWDIALFLDTQKFEKASAQQVWNETRRKVNSR